jgi:hypothetical protein
MSWVYFMRGLRNNRIKIGYSARPKRRMHELSCRLGEPIETLFLLPGTLQDEREFHKRFVDYTDMRIGREWFRNEGYLKSFIEKSLASGASPNPEIDRSIDYQAAKDQREAAVERLCAHPKLTWKDCSEILGPLFSISTLQRNY